MDQKANRGIPNSVASNLTEIRTQQNQRQEEELDLREIFSLLVHHAWVFALAALIGALLVGLYVKLFVPAQYTARATIYVFSLENDPSSQTLSMSDRMTTDFQIIATTSTTIGKVVGKAAAEPDLNIGPDTKVSDFKKENTITVTNPEGSHMLRISVTNKDPVAATWVSNTLAEVMCDQIAEIMKSERPQFVEEASLGVKTSPYVRRDALIGGVVFGLIAAIFVLVRYFVNDTITTEEDVNRYLGLTILSSVPLERNMTKQ